VRWIWQNIDHIIAFTENKGAWREKQRKEDRYRDVVPDSCCWLYLKYSSNVERTAAFIPQKSK